MNITIIGAGKIGRALIRSLLLEGHNVTIVEESQKVFDDCINNFDVNGVIGNGASIAVLQDANVKDADLVIACTSLDEVNMVACLAAKSLGAKETIARVRNYDYYTQTQFISDELKIDAIVNPEMDTARVIARLLRFPSALMIDTFAGGRVDLVKIKIEHDNPLNGMALKDIFNKFQLRVIVASIERNGEAIIPIGDTIIEEDDEVYLTSSQAILAKFFKKLNIYKGRAKGVMIAGGGKIAFYLAKALEDDGINIKIIEKDPSVATYLAQELPNALVIKDDASLQNVLEEENISSMDSVVALTGLDEENMLLSLYAKKRGVDQVITKINRTSYLDILEDQHLDRIVVPSVITADNIVRYVRGMKLGDSNEFRTLYRLMDGEVEAAEFKIMRDAEYTNVTFKELKFKTGIIIGAIIRKNQVIIPNGDDMILNGDKIVIFSKGLQVNSMNDILR